VETKPTTPPSSGWFWILIIGGVVIFLFMILALYQTLIK
jgi:hypothetical protein